MDDVGAGMFIGGIITTLLWLGVMSNCTYSRLSVNAIAEATQYGKIIRVGPEGDLIMYNEHDKLWYNVSVSQLNDFNNKMKSNQTNKENK